MAVRLGGSGAVMAVHGTVQQVARLGRAALRRRQLSAGRCGSGAAHGSQQLLRFFLFNL